MNLNFILQHIEARRMLKKRFRSIDQKHKLGEVAKAEHIPATLNLEPMNEGELSSQMPLEPRSHARTRSSSSSSSSCSDTYFIKINHKNIRTFEHVLRTFLTGYSEHSSHGEYNVFLP